MVGKAEEGGSMLLLIAFICFAVLILACMLAPTSTPRAEAPTREEAPLEGRQPVAA